MKSVQSAASSYPCVNILGVRVDAVTYGDVLDIINRWIEQRGPHQIATANPEFVMAAQSDAEFHQALLNADLCVADGVGLLWAARRLGAQLPERVTGSDLVPLVAEAAAQRGWRLYLLGAAAGVAEQTAHELEQRSPGLRIVGVYAGSPAEAEATAIVQRVTAAAPDVLLVAYGAPAQDLWVARHKVALGVPVMMGVGGAFDHIVGVQRRAPLWVQHMHLEWLWRLVTQPWRWRRQLALPRFVWAVWRQRARRVEVVA
ncbi:MAG TPA: WecB/TagA/CpsF family glycosyltransferase [Anaerolineae bacterium]|nr:WecB/TagA/CpsF family glycosyltransferase [Anaerolineae bacterium]